MSSLNADWKKLEFGNAFGKVSLMWWPKNKDKDEAKWYERVEWGVKMAPNI